MVKQLFSIFQYGLYVLLGLTAWQLNHAGVFSKIVLLMLIPLVCVVCLVRIRSISAFVLVTLIPLAIGVLGYQKGVPLNAFLVDLLPFLMFFAVAVVFQYSKVSGLSVPQPSNLGLVLLFGVLLISLLVSVVLFQLPLMPGGRLAGPLGSAVLAIYILVILLPILSGLMFEWRKRYLAVALVLMVFLLATKARMPLGAFIVGFGVLIVFYVSRFPKRFLLPFYSFVAIAVLSIGVLFVYKNGFTLSLSTKILTGRDYIWWVVQQNVQASPWYGFGFGHSYFTLSEAGVTNGLQPHSEIFRVLHNQGLIGLAAFVGVIVFILLRLVVLYVQTKSQKHKAILSAAASLWAAFLALSLTDNVLIYPFYMVLLFWFTLSSLTFFYTEPNKQNELNEVTNER